MDAVFPSHNVSENLPKRNDSITNHSFKSHVSRNVQATIQVDTTSRVNRTKNHIMLRYGFRIEQIRSYLITNCYKLPEQVVVIVWIPAYSPATLMQHTSAPVSSTIRSATVCVVPARRSKPQASYFFQPDNRNHSSSLHFLAFRALLTVLFLVRKYHWENMLSR